MKKLLKTAALTGGILFAVKGLDNRIEVTHYDISSPKIPEGFDGYKILQISDYHADSFRVIVNSSDFTQTPSITFVYVYNVDAVNPLDFTQISNDSLAVKMDLSHDNNGKLAASYELIKTVTADAQQ